MNEDIRPGAGEPDERASQDLPAADVGADDVSTPDVSTPDVSTPEELRLQDEAVARLRAADPAHDVEVSAGFVDSVLARTSAADTAAAEATASGAVVDLAAARTRRRPAWLTSAAAAAAAVVIGVGGYAVGAGSGSGGSDTSAADAPAAAPAIQLSQPGASGADSAAGSGMSDAGGAESLRVGAGASQSAADSMIYPGGWRTVYEGSGFGTAEGTATGYGLDARSQATSERTAALAAAFGVAGEPTLSSGSWIVGPQDGSAANVTLSLDGQASFGYSNPALNPWARCNEIPQPTDTDPDSEGWQEYNRQLEECYADLAAEVPSVDAAQQRMRDLLAQLGYDPASFELSDTTYEGSPTRSVVATRVVDGQATTLTFSLALVTDGVTYAYGTLAEPVSLGEYPIISETDALARLNDPRFGAQNVVWPLAVEDARSGSTADEYVPPTEAPATPTELAPVAWPVTTVQLVSVRLGLAQSWQTDGSVLLVPAYEFTTADGGTVSVIAVADSMLDLSPAS